MNVVHSVLPGAVIPPVPRGLNPRETDPEKRRQLDVSRNELYPQHGKDGWMLAKYEWRDDGSCRFLYVRGEERREVHRTQKGWL